MKYIVIFSTMIFIMVSRYKINHSAKNKGIKGEKEVNRILRSLPWNKYIVIDDIMVKSDSGLKYTQIDHIVVSTYGIFVIETKNYNGRVFGAENSGYWYQNVNGKFVKFRNPIKQNYAHIMGLKKFLNIKMECFISIVAFSDQCELEIDSYDNCNVVNFKNLKKNIKSYNKIVIEESNLISIRDKIYKYNIRSSKARNNHSKVVQRKVEREKSYISRCPHCGGRLVKKKGKYGYFKGCRNFPECRFTSDF